MVIAVKGHPVEIVIDDALDHILRPVIKFNPITLLEIDIVAAAIDIRRRMLHPDEILVLIFQILCRLRQLPIGSVMGKMIFLRQGYGRFKRYRSRHGLIHLDFQPFRFPD